MTERFFVVFEDVETKNVCLLEAYPDTAIATPKNFLVFNMPENQTEIKILGKNNDT